MNNLYIAISLEAVYQAQRTTEPYAGAIRRNPQVGVSHAIHHTRHQALHARGYGNGMLRQSNLASRLPRPYWCCVVSRRERQR